MRRWMSTALLACTPMIWNCAGRRPSFPAAPQIEMPAEATRPCSLYMLPDKPTEGDLEIGYATRGAQLVACDAARRLAVQTHEAEHALEAAISPRKRAKP